MVDLNLEFKEIRGDFVRRTKKAIKLTPQERAQLARAKKKLKRKVTRKKIAKLGRRVDFRRLI